MFVRAHRGDDEDKEVWKTCLYVPRPFSRFSACVVLSRVYSLALFLLRALLCELWHWLFVVFFIHLALSLCINEYSHGRRGGLFYFLLSCAFLSEF